MDLYKHYLELIIKLNALHYAITGAILSFYFSMAGSGAIRWSLLLPIGMSFGMAGIFIWGGFGNLVTRKT